MFTWDITPPAPAWSWPLVTLSRGKPYLVEVGGVEGLEGEVVNDEPVNRDQPAQLDLAGLVEAGRL